MTRPADLPDGRLEDELRAAFAGATADLPPTRDPWARTTRAVIRSRARRRAAALTTTVVAALAVAGTLLPLRGAAPDPSTPQPRPTVTSDDVTTWPTRGNLADRSDLLADVRAVAGRGGDVVVGIPFVGEVDGIDVALVVTWGVNDQNAAVQQLVALYGPAARPVRSWDRAEEPIGPKPPGSVAGTVLTAAVRDAADRVRLVVLTRTDRVTAAYSPRPDIDARGVVTRRFRALVSRDGVATTTFDGTVTALTVRVQSGDAPPVILAPQVMDRLPATNPRRLVQQVAESCREPAFGSLLLNLDNMAADAADEAGRTRDQIELAQAVGCREVAGHAVMFTAVRLEDGTTLQSVQEDVRETDGHGFTGGQPRPVPQGRTTAYPTYTRLTPIEERPAAVVGRTALFCGPAGASAELVAQSYDGTRRVVVAARLGADGVGVATAPRPLDSTTPSDVDQLLVVVRDGAGRALEEVLQFPDDDDPWGLRLDGPVDGA